MSREYPQPKVTRWHAKNWGKIRPVMIWDFGDGTIHEPRSLFINPQPKVERWQAFCDSYEDAVAWTIECHAKEVADCQRKLRNAERALKRALALPKQEATP